MVVIQINVLAGTFQLIEWSSVHEAILLANKGQSVNMNAIAAALLNAAFLIRSVSAIGKSIAQFVLVGVANAVFTFPFAAHAWSAHLFALVNLANLLGIRLGEAESLIADRFIFHVK